MSARRMGSRPGHSSRSCGATVRVSWAGRCCRNSLSIFVGSLVVQSTARPRARSSPTTCRGPSS